MSFRNEIMRNPHQKNGYFGGVFRQDLMFESGNQLTNQLPLWFDNANPSAEELVHHHHQNQWLNRGVKEEEDVSSSLYYINTILNHQETNPEAFGLVTSSFPALDCFNSLNHTRYEDHHQILGKCKNNLNGSTSASTLTSINGDHTLMIDDTNSSPLMGMGMGMGMRMNMPGEDSLTRDFLGVGVKELQEFASMEMGRYSTNY